MQYYLGLSDKKARFLREICKLKLSTEYSVKKLENTLLGNLNWVKMKQINFPKWFRQLNNELKNLDTNGQVPRVVADYAQISGDQLPCVITHWAQLLFETNQLVELGDMPNCPTILRNKLVVVVGDDSGQGYTRYGSRFYTNICTNPYQYWYYQYWYWLIGQIFVLVNLSYFQLIFIISNISFVSGNVYGL